MMHMLISSVHLWSGRVAQALEPAVEAESLFEKAADDGGASQARVTRGRALIMLGRIEEGWPLLAGGHPSTGGNQYGIDGDRTVVIGVCLGSVAIGDPARAEAIIAHYDDNEIDLESIGGVDLLAGLALFRLQLGDVGSAGDLVDRFVEPDSTPAPALAAVATLIEVARGRSGEAVRLADSVATSGRSTFIDRATASTALGLLAATEGRPADSAGHFADAQSEVDPTDDHLDQAMVALARSEALTALGAVDEADAARDASAELWAGLGVEPTGWRTAFALSLGAASTEGV
jgi:hypothetical protein